MPDRWLVVEVEQSEAESVDDVVVEILVDVGGGAVEERGNTAITYLDPSGLEPEQLVTRVGERLSAAGIPAVVSWRWQEHEAWEELWKQGLGLRRITDRIAVRPSWVEPEEPLPEITLQIDPGLAFGTAEHPTTRGCLRLLDSLVRPGDRILDAGSGSAILSIAAEKLGARQVVAVELDGYACEAARDNLAANGATAVEIVHGAVTPEWLARQEPYDGVVANIQSHILMPLLDGFRSVLRPGAWLLLSGILDVQWAEVQAAAESAGFAFQELDSEEEWRSGRLVAI